MSRSRRAAPEEISSSERNSLTTSGGAILDSNTSGADIAASTLALSASTGIGTSTDPLETQVASLEAQTDTGGIFIENGVTTPVTLNVGGVTGVLAGVQVTGASGDVSLLNHGTINVLTNGDTIRGPGNVTVKALGSLPVKLFHVGKAALGLEKRDADFPMRVSADMPDFFPWWEARTFR